MRPCGHKNKFAILLNLGPCYNAGMRKILKLKTYIVVATIAVFVAPTFVFGNDYASNKEAWINHDKIVCFGIDNIDQYKNDYLVIYDYSTEVGTKLGKPWATVERGKCYEVDFTNEEVYVFKYPLSSEAELVFNGNKSYIPNTNIADILKTCDLKPDYETYCHQDGISRLQPFDGFYGIGESAEGASQSTAISLDSVLPTKYSVHIGYTGFFSHFGNPYSTTGVIKDDERYVYSKALFGTLASKLDQATEQCDIRQRIEERFSLRQSDETDSSKIKLQKTDRIWRLSAGEDVIVDFRTTTPLQRVELLGCTATLHKFLKDYQQDIQGLENAFGGIYTDYCASTGDYDACSIVKLRGEEEYSLLRKFADASPPSSLDISEIPRVEASAKSQIQKSPEITSGEEPDRLTTATTTGISPVSSSEATPDEPSSFSVMQLIYFGLIPLVGVGGLIWIVRNLRKKATDSTFNQKM